MTSHYSNMRIFLGELLKSLHSNEVIAVDEVLEQAHSSNRFKSVSEAKLRATVQQYIHYYKNRGVINYEISGYIERTDKDFVIRPPIKLIPVTSERVEDLIEKVRNNPNVTSSEIAKYGHRHTLHKAFGNLNNLKRVLRIDEKHMRSSRFYSLRERLSPDSVDRKFFEFVKTRGRVPTVKEFGDYDWYSLSFIKQGYYSGISNWTEYVESKGYKTHYPGGKITANVVKRLYRRGLSDSEMAEKLSVDRRDVGYWRNKLGLPSHLRREYKISKSFLVRTIKETGSFARAAGILKVKKDVVLERAKKYSIPSPIFIYDDIIEILEKKGPRTTKQLIGDLKYKEKKQIDTRGAKQHGLLSTKLPASNEHLCYLPEQAEQAERVLESLKQEKIQKLLKYLKRHPNATYIDVYNAGVGRVLIHFFGNKLTEAKKIAKVPYKEYKRQRKNVYVTIRNFLYEHGPSLPEEIVLGCNLDYHGISSVVRRKPIKSMEVPAYRSNILFLPEQEDAAIKKKEELISRKKEALLNYLRSNPNCTRKDVVKTGYGSALKFFFGYSIREARRVALQVSNNSTN